MRLYVCDYQVPRSDNIDFVIVEADDVHTAERKAIQELKTLNIPKRYILNIEEVL